MIDFSPEYLRSQRTTSQADADRAARERARFDLSPTDRLHVRCGHSEYEGARH
jgi:hypothetical protein